MSAAYVHASALVKLFKPEPETTALMGALPDWSAHLSSELIVVEALCTARRLGTDTVERAALALDGLDLVPFKAAVFTAAVRNRAAATSFAQPLRALDAIHLATVLSLGSDVEVVVAYDLDLCEAARSLGLAVISPA